MPNIEFDVDKLLNEDHHRRNLAIAAVLVLLVAGGIYVLIQQPAGEQAVQQEELTDAYADVAPRATSVVVQVQEDGYTLRYGDGETSNHPYAEICLLPENADERRVLKWENRRTTSTTIMVKVGENAPRAFEKDTEQSGNSWFFTYSIGSRFTTTYTYWVQGEKQDTLGEIKIVPATHCQ